MADADREEPTIGWREYTREIIFEADTQAGKFFDVSIIVIIIASVAVVILESVEGIRSEHGELLRIIEWVFTLLFTLEYCCGYGA